MTRTLSPPLAAGLLTGAAVVTATFGLATSAPHRAPAATATAAGAQAVYARTPMTFEANGGRTDKRVRYLSRGPGYTLFLTDTESVLSLSRGKGRDAAVVRTSLAGADAARATPERRLPGRVNSFVGARRNWRTGIPAYGGVRYRAVYPGTDVVYHGRQGRLEYDFELQPGADPSRIGLDVAGADRLALARNGDLLIHVDGGTLRQHRPVAYQRIDGRRQPVAARFVLRGDRIGFAVGRYDRRAPLVIDPVLTYSSYLGGGGLDQPRAIAVATDRTVYVTAVTTSTNFPGATRSSSNQDAVVTRIAADGKSILFTTYLGGLNGAENPYDVALDSSNRPYIAGSSSSTDFPLDEHEYSCNTLSGTDAFLTRLTTTGTMSYSTCLGGDGTDTARGVAVTGTTAFVAGETTSTDYPTTNGAQTVKGSLTDAFLTKLPYSSSKFCSIAVGGCLSVSYSTLLGGGNTDAAYGVAVDGAGVAYIAGRTVSDDFPTKNAGQATDPDTGGYDAFAAAYDTSTTGSASKAYATYIGGTLSDYANDVDVTSTGTAYVAGQTYSHDDTSTSGVNEGIPNASTSGNLQPGAGADGFISQVNSSGTLSSASYIGGGGTDELNSIAVFAGPTGTIAQFVIGNTDSGTGGGLETQNPISGQTCANTNKQALVAMRSTSASPVGVYVTCLGGTTETGDFGTGIDVDSDGNAYVTGYTGGGFPLVTAIQAAHNGGTTDGFIARISQKQPTINTGPSGVISTKDAQFTFSTDELDMSYECSSPVSSRLVAGTRSATAGGSCGSSGTATYTGLAEGTHTFEAVTVTDVSTRSAPAVRTFTVDTVAPAAFDLTAPAEGEVTTTKPALSWGESVDAGTAVTYDVLIDDEKAFDVTGAAACSAGTCSATPPTALTTGPHSWQVRARDGNNHERLSTSKRNFVSVDPPAARFSIAPNPALVGRNVTFDATASTDASHTIAKHEWDLDGDGTFETDAGAAQTTVRTYDKAQTVTVSLRVTDSSGSTASTSAELKVNDLATAGTQVGVTINNGAQYTNKPEVTLNIVPPASATGMLVSNDGGFIGALPFDPLKVFPWKLDSSGPERLPKTVYVRFLTGTFASSNFTDDIILDERPPVVNSAAIAGAAGASVASAAKARSRKYTIKVKAKDSNSGVAGVQVTASKKKPGKLLKYRTKLKVAAKKRPKFLRAKDRAGNYSKWKRLR